jgi:hypothetical protein
VERHVDGVERRRADQSARAEKDKHLRQAGQVGDQFRDQPDAEHDRDGLDDILRSHRRRL